jgi:hypothetical protein
LTVLALLAARGGNRSTLADSAQPPMTHADQKMSRSDRESSTNSDDASPAKVTTRIDPPHVISSPPAGVDIVEAESEHETTSERAREMATVGAGTLSQAAARTSAREDFPPPTEQLEFQAEQIADHLRTQQDQIDRRAAELNAQLAERENEARSARLWLAERQDELAILEAQLTDRERAIEDREAALARADRQQAEAHERAKADQRRQSEAFTASQRELDERQRALDVQETEQAAVSAALARTAAEQQQLESELRQEARRLHRLATDAVATISCFLRGEDLPEYEAQFRSGTGNDETTVDFDEVTSLFSELAGGLKRLRDRQKNLEQAETLLDDGQAELDDARKRFDGERREWRVRIETEQRQMAEIQARAAREAEKQFAAIDCRAEQVERRSAAIDQLRAEVLRTQRETLELRLATDELWAQMAGAAPPAALSQSLAQIRGKLAEQYRLQRAEIAGEKKELEGLVERVDRERERVKGQRQDLERWAANRQDDIEGQAARLAAREHQIDQRAAKLEEILDLQVAERQAYQREIRRLLGQIRREPPTE